MSIRNIATYFQTRFELGVLAVLDVLLLFSILFGMLFLLFMGVRAVFGDAAGKCRGRVILALAAAAVVLQCSPVGDSIALFVYGMVARTLPHVLGEERYLPAMFLVACLWLAGVVLHLLFLAIRCLRLWRELARLPEYFDADVLAEACAQAGVRGPVTIRAAGKMRQVASWGIVRACILAPDDFAERFTPEERRWMYLHELTHFKRRDPLLCIALALWRACFWFDPACRKAAQYIRHDFELACDDAVVWRHDADPLEYARLITKAAALERGMPVAFSGFGEIGHRVRRLIGVRERKSARRIACGAVVALAMLFAFVWRAAAAPEKTSFFSSRSHVVVWKDGTVREFLFHGGRVVRYGVFAMYLDISPPQGLPAPDMEIGGTQEIRRWDAECGAVLI